MSSRPRSWFLDLERLSRGILAADAPIVFARRLRTRAGRLHVRSHRRPFWRCVETTIRFLHLSGTAGRSHGAIERAVSAWRDRGLPEFDASIIVRAAMIARVGGDTWQ